MGRYTLVAFIAVTVLCTSVSLVLLVVAGSVTADGDTFVSPGNTTYYVDSASGSDEHNGTSPEQAWRSLDRINSAVFSPGDKILLKADTRYTGRLRLQGSGASGRPITLGSYGDGAKPRIDAQGLYREALLLHNAEYWELTDLELTNQGTDPSDNRKGVYVYMQDFGTAHHIQLKRLYVHDVNGSNVKGLCKGIHCENEGKRVKTRFDGLLIEDCHLLRTDRDGIVLSSNDYWRRTNWHPNLNVVIRGNLLEDIGGDGIVPWACDGCVVEHNVLRGGRMRCDDFAAGIWPWSCDNTVIQFNEVSGMRGLKDGQGFDSDWNCRNTLFQFNYSHDNDGGFMLICDNGNAKAPGSVGNTGTVIRYNISQNDGLTRVFHIGGPATGTRIYGNTIYIGPEQDVDLFLNTSWHGWPGTTVVRNNIFYVAGTARYRCSDKLTEPDGTYVKTTGFGESKMTFESNVYFGKHIDPPADPKAIDADPMLTKPGTGGQGLDTLKGYQLREGSPCMGAGVPIEEPGTRDFWGHRIDEELAMNIGADQRR